jgi:hypothetical protein
MVMSAFRETCPDPRVNNPHVQFVSDAAARSFDSTPPPEGITVLIVPISDLDTDGLSDYARLTDVALRRVSEPEGGLYIAESHKVIARAIAAGHEPRSLLLQERWLPDVEPLLDRFPDVPVYVGDSDVLEKLTGYHMHRGALAAMHRPELPDMATLLRDATRVVIL